MVVTGIGISESQGEGEGFAIRREGKAQSESNGQECSEGEGEEWPEGQRYRQWCSSEIEARSQSKWLFRVWHPVAGMLQLPLGPAWLRDVPSHEFPRSSVESCGMRRVRGVSNLRCLRSHCTSVCRPFTKPSLPGSSLHGILPLAQPSSGLLNGFSGCYQLHVRSCVHHLGDVLQGKAFGGHG